MSLMRQQRPRDEQTGTKEGPHIDQFCSRIS
jgi:hypothetical protein